MEETPIGETFKQLEDYKRACLEDEEDQKALVLSFQTLLLKKKEASFFRHTFDPGHVTASAWVVDVEEKKALFTSHKKLKMWLPLGGHVDLGERPLEAAMREVQEESGLLRVRVFSEKIFHLGCHRIPAYGSEKSHLHFDICFLFLACAQDTLIQSSESEKLQWFDWNIEEFFSLFKKGARWIQNAQNGDMRSIESSQAVRGSMSEGNR